MVTHMIQHRGADRRARADAATLVADAYEDQVEATISRGSPLCLRPITILIMGGVIFIVALGLLLMPMHEQLSAVHPLNPIQSSSHTEDET